MPGAPIENSTPPRRHGPTGRDTSIQTRLWVTQIDVDSRPCGAQLERCNASTPVMRSHTWIADSRYRVLGRKAFRGDGAL